MRLVPCLLLLAVTAGAARAVTLDELAITVTADHPREFIFTDKGAAHLAGEAVGADSRSYHGFYIAMHEVVDGWSLRLEDGTEVGPRTAYAAEVTPDRLVRRHRLPDGTGITETVEIFDRQNGFRVVYDGVPAGRFAFIPRIDMRFLWRVGQPGYEVRWQDGALRICRQDARDTEPDPAHPHWLAIAVRGAQGFTPDGRHLSVTYPKGRARKAMDQASPYLPGSLDGHIPPRVPSGRVEAVFAADVSEVAAADRAARLRAEAFELLADRRARMQDLIDTTALTTGNPRHDRALAWSRISLDNLVMDQRGKGIYAGFYWFTTYWGRDTFISLPGTAIVSGRFDLARDLLRDFGRFQMTDPDSPRLGRVPNFVTVEQVQYASIDGTWWYARAVDELWRWSGDADFARESAPVIFRAVEGALDRAVDPDLFLVHGDGETWMDAGGEEHPYSPRGNRAVEVQALWHRGLLTAARLAHAVGDEERAARYGDLAARLATAFHAHFWQDGRLVDHLNPDGSRDGQVRPNGLLAVLASPTLFSDDQREAITAEAAEQLVMPWGVRSLTAEDPFYHPRHLDLDAYYYDEAYHNGDVWLWLSGAYVSALNETTEGFGQTRMLLDEVLDEGAVGTLQEIRDGDRAASNDEFGGATSQAWTLAELLRNVVQDYAGLRPDLTATPPSIVVAPTLPQPWPQLAVRSRIGDAPCLLEVKRLDGELQVGLFLFAEPDPAWVFRLQGPKGARGKVVRTGPGRWEVQWH
jgi:glycogen debranching enzyme